jgi:hypothetical protein
MTTAFVNIKDAPYNAKGDGVTDDTAAFQAAFDDLFRQGFTGSIGKITVPLGTYAIKSPLWTYAGAGWIIEGAGSWCTRLVWSSDATGDGASDAMLNFVNYYHCSLRDICLWSANSTVKPSALVKLLSDSSRPYETCTAFEFVKCWFSSVTYGFMDSHVVWDFLGFDQNNECAQFRNCKFSYADVASCQITGANAKANTFTDCTWQSVARAVWARNIGTKAGGAFSVYGGTVGDATETAFELSINDSCNLVGVVAEKVNRFLVTNQGSSLTQNIMPVNMIGCRIATETQNEDQEMIRVEHAGPVLIQGNTFESFVAPPHNKPSVIRVHSRITCPQVVTVVGNAWNGPATGDASSYPVACAHSWPIYYYEGPPSPAQKVLVEGNLYRAANGVELVIKPEEGRRNSRGYGWIGTLKFTGKRKLAVKFDMETYDTNYQVSLTPTAYDARTFTAGSNRVKTVTKSTKGFTVELEARAGGGAGVDFDWSVTR